MNELWPWTLKIKSSATANNVRKNVLYIFGAYIENKGVFLSPQKCDHLVFIPIEIFYTIRRQTLSFIVFIFHLSFGCSKFEKQ